MVALMVPILSTTDGFTATNSILHSTKQISIDKYSIYINIEGVT